MTESSLGNETSIRRTDPPADRPSRTAGSTAKGFAAQVELIRDGVPSGARAQPATFARPALAEQHRMEIFQQVHERLAAGAAAGGGRVKMTLHPQALGRLEVQIRVEEGAMRALIVAEDSAVREVLVQQQGELRESLERHGMKLQEFTVTVRDERQPGGQTWSDRSGEGPGGWTSPGESVRNENPDALAPRRYVNPRAIVDVVV